MTNNRKILFIGGISGFLASLTTKNIQSWTLSFITALIVGTAVGLIGINFFSD